LTIFSSLVSTVLCNVLCRNVCHNCANDQAIFLNSYSEIYFKFTGLQNVTLMTSGCPSVLPVVG